MARPPDDPIFQSPMTRFQSLSNFPRQHSIFPSAICNRCKVTGRSTAKYEGGNMGFIAALRQAEEQGKSTAKLALNEIAHQVHEAETAVRRRMRVHPHPTVSAGTTEAGGLKKVSSTEDQLKPIVSIHGQDVSEEDIDHTAA